MFGLLVEQLREQGVSADVRQSLQTAETLDCVEAVQRQELPEDVAKPWVLVFRPTRDGFAARTCVGSAEVRAAVAKRDGRFLVFARGRFSERRWRIWPQS